MADRCEVCKNPLPSRPKGQRGAPQVYCKPDTGRPCRNYAKRWAALRSMADAIVLGSPSSTQGKALHSLKSMHTEARTDLQDRLGQKERARRGTVGS